MALIDTAKITNGMILARDVTNLEGRVLLRKGLALSSRHVTAIKAWGIERVQVEAADPPDGGAPEDHEATSAKTAEIENELADIFQHTDRGHPVIESLYQEARNRRLGGAA